MAQIMFEKTYEDLTELNGDFFVEVKMWTDGEVQIVGYENGCEDCYGVSVENLREIVTAYDQMITGNTSCGKIQGVGTHEATKR